MILTGPQILLARSQKQLSIEPFSVSNLNPNSYNFRLSQNLFRVTGGNGGQEFHAVCIPQEGYVLEPGNLYLGATHERIGSSTYAMTLLGRSSTGRLGIFLNATADLGHRGSDSSWTLEISVVQAVRIYAHMKIGQVAFWAVSGDGEAYRGRYYGDTRPEPCKDALLA